MASLRESLLHKILSQPSAPFREGHVIHTIQEVLRQNSVPHFMDPVGNLIVGAHSKEGYLHLIQAKSDEPVRLLIAHMDHPGFHGTSWKASGELEVKWHGGSPTQHLERSKVWLADRSGWVGFGEIRNAILHSSGRAIQSATVLCSSADFQGRNLDPVSFFGGFAFRSAWWQEESLIYTKAADDLVGTFAIVSLALDLWKNGSPKVPFLGLLTRAEEVGFIGAIGHFELNWLQQASRPVIVVSIETSRTLPGAEIGKGPIVRLGDKFTVFDPGSLRIFLDLASSFPHQKRIMDGGTCEATAATVYGYPCVGISIPLGNYHNQSLEGGPDSAPANGPAPEFVHIQDIEGLINLCHALLSPDLPWSEPWEKKKAEFRKELENYSALIKSDP